MKIIVSERLMMKVNNSNKYIYEVFDLVGHTSIGFVKEPTYEQALQSAYARFQRPIDIVYHDQYTEDLRRNLR